MKQPFKKIITNDTLEKEIVDNYEVSEKPNGNWVYISFERNYEVIPDVPDMAFIGHEDNYDRVANALGTFKSWTAYIIPESKVKELIDADISISWTEFEVPEPDLEV